MCYFLHNGEATSTCSSTFCLDYAISLGWKYRDLWTVSESTALISAHSVGPPASEMVLGIRSSWLLGMTKAMWQPWRIPVGVLPLPHKPLACHLPQKSPVLGSEWGEGS